MFSTDNKTPAVSRDFVLSGKRMPAPAPFRFCDVLPVQEDSIGDSTELAECSPCRGITVKPARFFDTEDITGNIFAAVGITVKPARIFAAVEITVKMARIFPAVDYCKTG